MLPDLANAWSYLCAIAVTDIHPISGNIFTVPLGSFLYLRATWWMLGLISTDKNCPSKHQSHTSPLVAGSLIARRTRHGTETQASRPVSCLRERRAKLNICSVARRTICWTHTTDITLYHVISLLHKRTLSHIRNGNAKTDPFQIRFFTFQPFCTKNYSEIYLLGHPIRRFKTTSITACHPRRKSTFVTTASVVHCEWSLFASAASSGSHHLDNR